MVHVCPPHSYQQPHSTHQQEPLFRYSFQNVNNKRTLRLPSTPHHPSSPLSYSFPHRHRPPPFRPMSGVPPGIDLPEELLAVLPADPFEQLDVARKITSIALANRVSALEDEVSELHDALGERDDLVSELRSQVEQLDASLSDLSRRLARAEEEKESLSSENVTLSSTVKKLNKDVSKLEVFRKALMQSLQEDEGLKTGGARSLLNMQATSTSTFYAGSNLGDDDVMVAKLPSIQARVTERESVTSDDVSSSDVNATVTRPGIAYVLTPQNVTPRLTPPDSPTKFSASVSPRLSPRLSPRRQSISLSRNTYDGKASVSSTPSHYNSSGSFDSGNHPGRSRVDGKEFFRQVRNRLSYEQFSAFLANVKELNASKQTREEALLKADEIFGPSNKDLYAIFESLIARKS